MCIRDRPKSSGAVKSAVPTCMHLSEFQCSLGRAMMTPWQLTVASSLEHSIQPRISGLSPVSDEPLYGVGTAPSIAVWFRPLRPQNISRLKLTARSKSLGGQNNWITDTGPQQHSRGMHAIQIDGSTQPRNQCWDMSKCILAVAATHIRIAGYFLDELQQLCSGCE